MSSYKSPDLQERQSNASAAKKVMLEQFRAASHDPAVAKRRAARKAVNEARSVRVGQREAANREREAELVGPNRPGHGVDQFHLPPPCAAPDFASSSGP
jgi:hypothetical protein